MKEVTFDILIISGCLYKQLLKLQKYLKLNFAICMEANKG